MAQRLAFRFKRQYPHAIMKTSQSGNQYAAILVNSSDGLQKLKLAIPEKKTPQLIVGQAPVDKPVIALEPQDTAVILWK